MIAARQQYALPVFFAAKNDLVWRSAGPMFEEGKSEEAAAITQVKISDQVPQLGIATVPAIDVTGPSGPHSQFTIRRTDILLACVGV